VALMMFQHYRLLIEQQDLYYGEVRQHYTLVLDEYVPAKVENNRTLK
jgi:hypothetical protein